MGDTPWVPNVLGHFLTPFLLRLHKIREFLFPIHSGYLPRYEGA